MSSIVEDSERRLAPRADVVDETEYVSTLEAELDRYRDLFARSQRALLAIQASHGWKCLLAYYEVRNLLLPPSSLRYAVLRSLFQAVLGSATTCYRRIPRLFTRPQDDAYARWIRQNEPSAVELQGQCRQRFAWKPRLSVVVPTHNPAEAYLQAMVQSLIEQTYSNWELCLADGATASVSVRNLLRKYAAIDSRVRIKFLPTFPGRARTANEALTLASGDYVLFLDAEDRLAPFTLFEIARAVTNDDEVDFLYADEDRIDAAGRRREPRFKPDWSPETLRGHNYIGCPVVLRRELLENVGALQPEFEGAEDYDLVLRASEGAGQIVHIAKVLYHRRTPPREGLVSGGAAERRALSDHLRRSHLLGHVAPGPNPGTHQVAYALAEEPLVSILIPSRDQADLLARCVQSILRGSYRNIEIVIIENQSRQAGTFRYYRELEKMPRIRVLDWDDEFNYSAVNNHAASQARGDVLLFLNNDTQAISPGWLEAMLEHATRPEVGIVGAKLYYPDDTVQHAGVILGIKGTAGHAHRHCARAASGYGHRLLVTQNVSAVTGACLMVRRNVFEEVGGFDERFLLAYNDFDLCLRVRQRGWQIIWTPFAELYHFESKTRGRDDTPQKRERLEREVTLFLHKWGALLEAGDPYYNRNLTLEREDFSLKL